MNWTLEVVQVPVTDVDRAKAFYADQVGFLVDHDTTVDSGDGGPAELAEPAGRVSTAIRFAQLTPPGSGCSIVVSTALVGLPPGSQEGVQLVVRDVRAARAELAGRGVDVSEVRVFTRDGVRPARDDDDLNNVGFCYFSDPDGNGWAVQQISSRS